MGAGRVIAVFPEIGPADVSWIDRAQMEEVDRVMIDELGIDLVRMMEGAGRTLAVLAERRFDPRRVVVCAGSGGNGGGGLVAARHLANHGRSVTIVLGSEVERLGPVPRQQLDIATRLGIPLSTSLPSDVDLVVDALIGYSLSGNPRGRTAELINAINGLESSVLSLDTPSGLDVSTGEAATPAVSATATMTLAAPKTGLRRSPLVGELYLADISVPPSVYSPFGAGPGPVFDRGPVVRIADGIDERGPRA